jgi:hypothetical protein
MRCLGENRIKPRRDDKTEKPDDYIDQPTQREFLQRCRTAIEPMFDLVAAIPGGYLNYWKQKTYFLRFRKHKSNKINDITFLETHKQDNFDLSLWKI